MITPMHSLTWPMDWVRAVADFYHEKRGDLPTPEKARDFLASEYKEFTDLRYMALDAEHELKELCDVIFTAIGYGLACGYDMSTAFERVCASNMTKDGGVVDDKIQKGPGYVEPDLKDLV